LYKDETKLRKYHDDNANDDGHDDAPHEMVLPRLTDLKKSIKVPLVIPKPKGLFFIQEFKSQKK